VAAADGGGETLPPREGGKFEGFSCSVDDNRNPRDDPDDGKRAGGEGPLRTEVEREEGRSRGAAAAARRRRSRKPPAAAVEVEEERRRMVLVMLVVVVARLLAG
jgi:hypothetical protein